MSCRGRTLKALGVAGGLAAGATFGSMFLDDFLVPRGEIEFDDVPKFVEDHKGELATETIVQGGTSAEDVARHTVTFGQQKVFEGSLVEDKKGPDGSEGQYSEYLPMYWAAGVKAAKGDYVGNDYVIPAKINWSSIKVRGLPYDHALRDLDETDKMFNPRDLVKVVGRPIIVDGKDVVIEYRDPHTNTVFKGPALMIEEIEH